MMLLISILVLQAGADAQTPGLKWHFPMRSGPEEAKDRSTKLEIQGAKFNGSTLHLTGDYHKDQELACTSDPINP